MSRRRQSANGRTGKRGPLDSKAQGPVSTAEDVSGFGPQWITVGAGLLLAVSVWSYWPTLTDVVRQWIRQPDYSHGFLVVPIAAWFLWSRRSKLPLTGLRPSVYGAIFLAAVSGLRIIAGAYYLQPLDGWTIPLWVAGAVWLLLGWRVLAWSLPSIVFLWFMIPIPYTAESLLSVPLQAIATKVSTACLVMLGQPALAEGNVIWIGDQPLFVEEACSGLRILVGIFALAFAFALFSRWRWWQKVLAVVAALPIAISANATRVVITALLYQFSSGEMAKHFMHDFSGLVMIPFAALLFWMFLVYLERLFPEVEAVSAFEAGSLAN